MGLFGFIILVACLIAFFQFPAFRKFIGLLVVLAVLAVVVNSAKQDQKKTLIKADQIELTDLRLSSGSYSSTLSGKLKNNSPYKLQFLSVEVTAYDCPTDILDDKCVAIGQSTVTDWVEVPPNQLRTFSGSALFHNMPTPKVFKWTYTIKEITAA